MTPENKERQAFEAWAKPHGYRCEWAEAKEPFLAGYDTPSAHYAWKGWQARSPVTGEAAPAEGVKPRFQWCCANGCGVCDVKRRMFEYERTEDEEGNLLESKSTPRLVSACCHAGIFMWDNKADEIIDLDYEPLPIAASPSMGAQRGSAALTKERIFAIADSLPHQPWGIGSRHSDAYAFARAIEAAIRGSAGDAGATDAQRYRAIRAALLGGGPEWAKLAALLNIAPDTPVGVDDAVDVALRLAGDAPSLKDEVAQHSLVHPAVPSGNVASPSPRSSPLESGRSELPRGPNV